MPREITMTEDSLELLAVEMLREMRDELPLPSFIESTARDFPCADSYTLKMEIVRTEDL